MPLHTGIVDGCFAKFDHPDVIPLQKIATVHVAEIWHGPTGAFKDLALSVVGRLVDHFVQKKKERATILVSTTGDTGSAAIQSVLGSKHTDIIVLYPRGRITRVQELQMTTVNAPNVSVYSADGTGDECDVPIKKIFRNVEFVSRNKLMSTNSINVGRVIFQAAHFIYSYLKLNPEVDRELTFSIPSGALGNATGGYIAYLMGLPIQLLVAVNDNDIIHRAFSTGTFSTSVPVVPTYSSAMDIDVPYNIERLFYFISGGKCETVKGIMECFEKNGSCTLPSEILGNNKCLTTAKVSMEKTLSTMEDVWREFQYPLCPHSAIGMRAALDFLQQEKGTARDVVVLATATGAKFPDTLEKAGIPLPSVPAITELYGKPETKLFMEKGEDWEGILRRAIEQLH